MTPLNYNAWLFQAALSACVLAGFAIVVVSIRTGWITKAIAWATAAYALTGAVMLLSPKWSTVVFEYKDFKTTISQLETANSQLTAQNEVLHNQIRLVASLGKADTGTAQAAVAKIKDTREAVQWADFLPANTDAYRLAVPANNTTFATEIATKLNSSPEAVTKAFESSGYTILKQPTANDLSTTDAKALWIGSDDQKQK